MIILIRRIFTLLAVTLFHFSRVYFNRIFISFLLLTSLPFLSYTQQSEPDLSLLSKKEKIDTLIHLGDILARDDVQAALKYTKDALVLSQSIQHHQGEAGAYLTLSRIYIIQSHYDSAVQVLNSAEKLILEEDLSQLKAELLNNYGWLAQRQKEFDKSIEYYRKAIPALTEYGTKTETSIYTNLGITFYFQSAFDSAKKYYEKSLLIDIARKDSIRMLNAYRNIGIVLRRQGKTRESIQLFFDALHMAEATDRKSSIADVNNSIGVAFDHLKEYDNALRHYLTTLEIRRQLPDKRRLANVLSNIGWVYTELKQYPTAVKTLREALKINEEIGGFNSNQAVFNNLGLAYKESGKYDSAYIFYQKSFAAYKSIDNRSGMALVFTNMASIHFNKGAYKEAISLLEKNKTLIETHGDNRTVINTYEHLFANNEKLGRTKEALKYHKLYKLMTDSVFNIDKTTELLELSEKYESDKKEQELAYKDTQIKTLEEIVDLRQKLIIISFIGGITVFALIGLLIWYKGQKRRKLLLAENELIQTRLTNEQLEKESVGLKLKSKEKELLSFALNLTQKNDLLRRMKEIIDRKVKNKGALKSDFKELETLIDSNDQSEKEWESFKHLFQELHHDFFNKLKVRHPDLTIYETRLCALIKLNLSSTEMGSMLNISTSSLTSARYRLRKKLGLSGKDDLNLYIEAFNGTTG